MWNVLACVLSFFSGALLSRYFLQRQAEQAREDLKKTEKISDESTAVLAKAAKLHEAAQDILKATRAVNAAKKQMESEVERLRRLVR